MLEFHAAPSHVAVEHVAVPDAVVVELAAVDVDVEALDVGVFDMRRAVHVAHQMHQILDADHDRRVVQRLVVAQQLHRILDSLDRIAVGLARGIVLVVLVDPGGMP